MADAWKQDVEGEFIDMEQGERTDYSIDWSAWLGDDTIGSVIMTIDSHLTQAGATEINGKVTKFTLVATGAAGVWACNIRLTSGAGLVKFMRFRVVVR